MTSINLVCCTKWDILFVAHHHVVYSPVQGIGNSLFTHPLSLDPLYLVWTRFRLDEGSYHLRFVQRNFVNLMRWCWFIYRKHIMYVFRCLMTTLLSSISAFFLVVVQCAVNILHFLYPLPWQFTCKDCWEWAIQHQAEEQISILPRLGYARDFFLAVQCI
jgi:hypothetical protein